jgi:hypothetical protein
MAPFWLLYKNNDDVLQHVNRRGAYNSEVGDDKGPRDGGKNSMKQIVEYIRSYSKALLHKMGVQVAEHPSHETVRRDGRPLRTERRRETRSPMISPCAYGVMRSVDPDGAILEEGHGAAVNNSATGMRLLLGVAPAKGQLLEIQIGHSTFRRAICLVEVCWTNPLREDVEGALYLVGCRLNFGTTHGAAV